MPELRSSYLTTVPSFRFICNNLKASWDSLMEAASHGHPRSFLVAVTVVLERLKREELKRKNKESKE
jgi:hypothetical protein